MKLLTIGDPNLNEVCKKYNCKLDDIYVIADMPKRMIYKKLGLQNVFYIKDINDIEEYKRVLGEIGMKFDKVIMNPPYEKNLHLKVVEEVMKYLDEDGEVVNLSPVRWLQDPLAKDKRGSDYNRFEDSISKHIKSIDIVSTVDAQKLFGALINTDLGVYKLNTNNYDVYKDLWEDTTNNNHLNSIKKCWCFPELKEYDETSKKAFVPLRLITNPARKTFYNICTQSKYLYEGKAPDGTPWKETLYKSNRLSNDRVLKGVYFNTIEEAKNFYESTLTIAYKYFVSLVTRDVNITSKYLPFMQDYTQPWTNERFYKYFNITKEEQKIIEETMAQYE